MGMLYMKQVNWDHKDEWGFLGKNFGVVVSRHVVTPHYDDRGCHRWCVYAYIYPAHWHFKHFDGDSMSQDAACALPLHVRPSYLRRHEHSVQVGADYNHLYDTRFTHFATQDEAYEVFNDAARLIEWLGNNHEQYH